MELIIDARKLYPLKDTMFYKKCGLSLQQEKKVGSLIVSGLRGHFFNYVNPITARDFQAGVSVKFKFGELTKESVASFEKYVKEVEDMNVWRCFDKALRGATEYLKGAKVGKEPVDDEKVEKIVEQANVWFKRELAEWDKKLKEEVRKAIKAEHGKKCKKKPGVYNFTRVVLSNSILDILNMGKNAIPEYKTSFRKRRKKFREDLLKALQEYRCKVQRGYQIHSQCPREWLKRVIAVSEE